MSGFSFEKTSKTIQLEQGELHYNEAGDGDPLILLHGSGPGVTGWANFQNNLPVYAQDFRCFIPDFPGYGKSAAVEGNPILACITAVIQFMDALEIPRANFLGNSMGGMVAAQIAAHQPDRVSKLISIGGIGMNIFSPFPGQGITLLSEFAEDPTRERVTSWLQSMVFDQALITEELIETRFRQATDPKTLASTRQLYSRSSLQAMGEDFRSANATQRIAHLPAIQAPTLLAWGRDDRVTPVDMALVPMRLIPNCELHIFPNCGHWAQIERKDEFESVTRAFLLR